MTNLVAETERAIEAATHLDAERDAGAIEAILALARKIDAWDVIVGWALADASDRRGGRPAVPNNDNVSLSAYLKYCEHLGLSPAGRKALDADKPGGASKLTAMRGGRSGTGRKSA